jgi:hypothetical protein
MSGASKADLQNGLTRCRIERKAAEDRVVALEARLTVATQELAQATARAVASEAAVQSLFSNPDFRSLIEAFPDLFP